MALSPRERAVALIAGGIAAYSARVAQGGEPPGASMVDFVMGAVPDGAGAEATMGLFDEVFAYVSAARAGPAAQGS